MGEFINAFAGLMVSLLAAMAIVGALAFAASAALLGGCCWLVRSRRRLD